MYDSYEIESIVIVVVSYILFFKDTSTTEIYTYLHTLSLHDALPIGNKKSVAIDLRQKEGQDIVRKLILEADIVIENFRPGTMERWGLDYESLSSENPGLIMLRISGYGQSGDRKSTRLNSSH